MRHNPSAETALQTEHVRAASRLLLAKWLARGWQIFTATPVPELSPHLLRDTTCDDELQTRVSLRTDKAAREFNMQLLRLP